MNKILLTLFVLVSIAFAGGGDAGVSGERPFNISAVLMFLLFVLGTLGVA